MGQKKLAKRWTLFRERPLRRAADVYSMVIENQPFTAAAAEAQYKVGLVQYTLKNYQEAAFEYRRVVEDYAGSDWVDEASYGLAQCYYEMSLPPEYDQSPSQLAVDAIDNFIDRYPDDERVAKLRDMRGEMVQSIARQRLLTARFYEKRRDFEAAYICYNIVVDEYPDTEAGQAAQEWLDSHPKVETAAQRVARTGATL